MTPVRTYPFAALALLAVAPFAADAAPPPPGSRYVAMGSSFASGPDIGPPRPETPARCTRSAASYPALLAARLGLVLVDETCSGATTEHVLGPWGELSAQIDAVAPETRLVTVTIGGNDLYYSSGLLAASCGEGGSFAFLGRTIPCPPPRAVDPVAQGRLEANLRRIVREVRRRAPAARLIFVEYPRLVPDRLCAATPLNAADAASSKAKADRLAEITRRVAGEEHAEVLPMNTLGRSHTACSRSPWVNGFPARTPGVDGIGWHPNRAGMAAMADLLSGMLGKRPARGG